MQRWLKCFVIATVIGDCSTCTRNAVQDKCLETHCTKPYTRECQYDCAAYADRWQTSCEEKAAENAPDPERAKRIFDKR